MLVTGAGPVGLLAALIAAQHGLDVHVLDHHEHLKKRELVRRLGGIYHLDELADIGLKPDILMECSGAPASSRDVLGSTAASGIVCLVGVTSPATISMSMSGHLTVPWCSTTTPYLVRSMPTECTMKWLAKLCKRPTKPGLTHDHTARAGRALDQSLQCGPTTSRSSSTFPDTWRSSEDYAMIGDCRLPRSSPAKARSTGSVVHASIRKACFAALLGSRRTWSLVDRAAEPGQDHPPLSAEYPRA